MLQCVNACHVSRVSDITPPHQPPAQLFWVCFLMFFIFTFYSLTYLVHCHCSLSAGPLASVSHGKPVPHTKITENWTAKTKQTVQQVLLAYRHQSQINTKPEHRQRELQGWKQRQEEGKTSQCSALLHWQQLVQLSHTVSLLQLHTVVQGWGISPLGSWHQRKLIWKEAVALQSYSAC